MNAPLRRVGVVVVILFGLLFANLNYVQAYMASAYRNSPYNGRVQLSEYQHERGVIELARGVVLARSVATGDTLKYLRTYPTSTALMYAFATGYKPVAFPPTGVEKLENDFLNGNADAMLGNRILEMLTGQKKPGGNVILSLSAAGQSTAYNDLLHNNVGSTVGAVVALDPTTGALLVDASIPSYDPNPLSSHDTTAALNAYKKLINDPSNPLLNRAFSENYPPGSTFKVIDAATALSEGMTPETVIGGGPSFQPPGTTHVIRNEQGVYCPGPETMKLALTVSCNTAYAELCVNKLDAAKIKAMAQAFGIESTPKLQLDSGNIFNVQPSHTGSIQNPDGTEDKAILAQSCIGQADVRLTPLQGAIIAATVANNGVRMQPYLIDSLQTPDLTTVYKATPKEVNQPISASVAQELQTMMYSVVANGTGVKAQINLPGVQVGGKTGTAQHNGALDHGWFIGFAMKDGKPVVAVAVFLADGGNPASGEATRIGGEVMKAIINERSGQ